MRTTRPQPGAFAPGTNPLTREDAGRIADCITWGLLGESDDDISRLLLLCHAFTYERDLNAREAMLCAVEERIGVRVPGFDGLVATEMRRQLDVLRKGGRR
jgi:hypothetical protein